MSGPRRQKVYEVLARRDGERCFIGTEAGNQETLVIDHWDNDNSNNDPENLHLVCRRMNYAKNPRMKSRTKDQSSVYVCERSNRLELERPRPSAAEFLKSTESEPSFRHWLFEEILKQINFPEEEIIDCGAEVARCSQVTIARYLKKVISRAGMYQVIVEPESQQRLVQLKPKWSIFRGKDEEKENLDHWAKNWREDDKTMRIAEMIQKKRNGAVVAPHSPTTSVG